MMKINLMQTVKEENVAKPNISIIDRENPENKADTHADEE